MKTYTQLLSQTAEYIPATSSLRSLLLNDGVRMSLGKHTWPFLEKTSTIATTANTQFYQLPYDYGQLISVIITIGSTQYTPQEAPNRNFWNVLNQTTSITSDIPTYFYIFGGTIGFYPKSASTAGTITLTYKKAIKDMSIADYTTGGVQSVANAGVAVVGTGTTWATSMAGRFIQITESDTANKGDGFWYEILSVASTTSLTLVDAYGGTAISAGNAAYTIGQCSVLPENYQSLPIWYAVGEYWATQREMDRAQIFIDKFNAGCAQMLEEFGEKSSNVAIDYGPRRRQPLNPNLTPTDVG